MSGQKASVAVIGLGACGLVTLKNLLEAGFDAVGFDSNDYIGGLWQYTEDAGKTSVLQTTVANLSKQMGCYTDFPYSNEASEFPTAAEVAKYLNEYADHFKLRQHMRLGTIVKKICPDAGRWEIQTVSKADEKAKVTRTIFDKVAIANGLQVKVPKIPKIDGLDTFSGQFIHSNGYKSASAYAGKRVVVVGFGNTGADTAVDLMGHASKIWLSFRKGNTIMSRRNPKGKPGDHILSLRFVKMGGLFNAYLPKLSQQVSLLGMKSIQNRAFDIKPEWKLGIPELPTRKVPVLNEHLIPALHKDAIQLKPALTSVQANTLHFSDGTTLTDIDTIIFCTGFRSDFTLLDPTIDPTRDTRKDWPSLPGANQRPLPRLYQGIFSLDHPTTLAFLGTSPLTPQAALNYDISSCAVAQIWAGRSTLPPREVMAAHVDAQHALVCGIAATGELANTNLRNNWDWFRWCDEAAGLGLVKRAGMGWDGWRFWWADRGLCRLVLDGLMSPHIFRLFDEGKRRPWEGARDAVEEANRGR